MKRQRNCCNRFIYHKMIDGRDRKDFELYNTLRVRPSTIISPAGLIKPAETIVDFEQLRSHRHASTCYQ